MADTFRFDLNDRTEALHHYRLAEADSARQRKSQPNAGPSALQPNFEWLKVEIAYVETGTRSPIPDATSCQTIAVLILFARPFFVVDDASLGEILGTGSGQRRDLAPAEIARRLEALSPTPIHLLATIELWPALGSPERILSFARKHDPAGYLTACAMRTSQMLVAQMNVEEAAPAKDSRSAIPLKKLGVAIRRSSRADRHCSKKHHAASWGAIARRRPELSTSVLRIRIPRGKHSWRR